MFKAQKTNIVRLNNKYKFKRFLTQKDFGLLNDDLIFLSQEINAKRYKNKKQPIAGTVIDSGFMDWKWNYISNNLFSNSIKKFPYSKINNYVKKDKKLKDKHKMKIYFRLSNTKSFICFAGAGSGKTTGPVLSSIYANALSPTKPNMLITDPKGELAKSTFNLLKEQNYNVRVLNILDSENTDCFSPFTVIKDNLYESSKLNSTNQEEENQKHALLNEIDIELTDIIYSLDDNPNSSKKDIWDKSAYVVIYLMAWLIIDDLMWNYHDWLSKNKELNEKEKRIEFDKLFIKFSFQSIFWTLGQFGDDGSTKYVQFYKDKYNIDLYHINPIDIFNHPGILKWQQVLRENPGNKSTFTKDVITNALKEVERFNSPLLKNMTIFNTFNLNDLYGNNDKPFALFVTINNSQPQTIPYITWFINYVLMKVNFYATQGAMTKLKKPLMCILEEIGNIGFIKNLPVTVNEGRGKNIFVSLFFQTHEQYLQKYGNNSGGFLRSCAYRLILSNAESSKFTKELCDYAGQYKYLDKKNDKYITQNRITQNDIYSLAPFKGMIFMNEINVPSITNFIPWHLLGIKADDRLSIPITDPNYIPSSDVAYNPLSKIEIINNQKTLELDENNSDNLNNSNSKKEELKLENNNLILYKEQNLNKKEKLLCEIFKIKYGSPDVQIVKDIIADQKNINEVLYLDGLNNQLNLNQILNYLSRTPLTTIKENRKELLELEDQIQQQEPNKINLYKQLKEFLILKDLVVHSSLNPMSVDKYIEIKNTVNLIQQINQKQFSKLDQVYSKSSQQALNFLCKIKKEIKFNLIFQFNNSFIQLLKKNINDDRIPKEIKEFFIIIM